MLGTVYFFYLTDTNIFIYWSYIECYYYIFLSAIMYWWRRWTGLVPWRYIFAISERLALGIMFADFRVVLICMNITFCTLLLSFYISIYYIISYYIPTLFYLCSHVMYRFLICDAGYLTFLWACTQMGSLFQIQNE